MNKSQVAKLLTMASAYDGRTIGDEDVTAWQAALGDTDFDKARDALVLHYRHSTSRLMPAHLWQRTHVGGGWDKGLPKDPYGLEEV